MLRKSAHAWCLLITLAFVTPPPVLRLENSSMWTWSSLNSIFTLVAVVTRFTQKPVSQTPFFSSFPLPSLSVSSDSASLFHIATSLLTAVDCSYSPSIFSDLLSLLFISIDVYSISYWVDMCWICFGVVLGMETKQFYFAQSSLCLHWFNSKPHR